MQDTRQQAIIALRWLPLILIGALAAGALAYVYADSQPRVYEATGTLEVSQGPELSPQNFESAQRAAVQYADKVMTKSVIDAVIAGLGLDDGYKALRDRIRTDTSEDTLELTVAARGADPEAARRLGRALGDELRARVREELITDEVKAADAAIAKNLANIRTLQNQLAQLQRRQNRTPADRAELIALPGYISSLQRDIQALRPGSRAFVRNLVDWAEEPALPETPVEPRPLLWTLLALVAGGMAAAGLAFVLEYLRTYNKVRSERDLEEATGLTPLGTVFEKRGDVKRGGPDRLVMLRWPRGQAAEAYRGLLTRIGFAVGTARTLMVASADGSDGRSTVAANLALAYAEAGRNVILVDADYRSPRQHLLFGVPNDRGVTNVLVDHDVPISWVLLPTSHPRLRLMPGGPPPPRLSGPLGARQVDALLSGLLKVADMVVVDSPSIAGNLDAAVLATQLDGAVLVVPADSHADAAGEAARTLAGAQIAVVGAILYRRVRGSHKRSTAMPVVAVPPGPATSWSAAPASPPRRIPATLTGTSPVPPGRPPGAAASNNGRRPSPQSSDAPPFESTRPPSGPFQAPVEPQRPTSG